MYNFSIGIHMLTYTDQLSSQCTGRKHVVITLETKNQFTNTLSCLFKLNFTIKGSLIGEQLRVRAYGLNLNQFRYKKKVFTCFVSITFS